MRNLTGVKMQREIKVEKVSKKIEDVVDESIIRVKDCMDNNPKCRIQIDDGIASKGNKEIVALSIEEHLLDLQRSGTKWSPQSFNDLNSARLSDHLSSEFAGEGVWVLNGTQDPFDMYNLDMRVSVELKSEKVKFKNKSRTYSRPSGILGNATIYPLTAKIEDIVNKKNINSNWDNEFLNRFIDVLVVIIFRDAKSSAIVDYVIVDGSYWGFDRNDFIGCREYFSIINNELEVFNKYLLRKYPDNMFIRKMVSGDYGDNVNLKIRKLITWKTPFSG